VHAHVLTPLSFFPLLYVSFHPTVSTSLMSSPLRFLPFSFLYNFLRRGWKSEALILVLGFHQNQPGGSNEST